MILINEYPSTLEKDIFLYFIIENNKLHPKLTKPIGYFIYDIKENKDYFLNISHPDLPPSNIDLNIILLGKNIFCLDGIYAKYFLDNFEINDILLNNNLEGNNIKIDYYSNLSIFYEKYNKIKQINKLIPIYILYENFKLIKSKIEKYLINNNFTNDLIEAFFKIENQKIKTDLNPSYNINNNILYNHYQFNTLTIRPTNNFNNYNLLTLNKNNDERTHILPTNNFLLEVDYNSYHPSLLSKLINFKIDNITEYFKKLLNEENTKIKIFEYMYGGLHKEELIKYDFFKQTEIYLDNIWEEINNKGFIITDMGKKILLENIKNKYQLLSHILQNTETYENVKTLKILHHKMRNLKSKIIIYFFDSFIIDLKKDEANEVKKILEENLNFSFKYRVGRNLKELK